MISMQKPIDFDRIWLEVRGNEEVVPAELIGGNGSGVFLLVSLSLKLRSGAIIHPNLHDSGSCWRVWAHNPTDEERKAAEWKD